MLPWYLLNTFVLLGGMNPSLKTSNSSQAFLVVLFYCTAALCSTSFPRSLQPAGEWKHQNKPTPKGSLSLSVRKHTCNLPSFVCLPPTYTQHEHESFPCPQLPTVPHLYAQPTHQNTTKGRLELLPLTGSFIVSNTQSPLSHSSFLYLSLLRQHSLSIISEIGDLTQRPHHSDFIRRQLQSGPQSQVLVEGTINTARVSGTPWWGCRWETSGWYQPPPCLKSRQSFKMCFCGFAASINWRHAHFCCLGN